MSAERSAIPPLKIALGNLRYVVAAAEKWSFRQAAIELGLWESTISRRIRELEGEIGVALFIRHPGGVKLTNAGSKYLSHARMAVSRIEYALKDASVAGRGLVWGPSAYSGPRIPLPSSLGASAFRRRLSTTHLGA